MRVRTWPRVPAGWSLQIWLLALMAVMTLLAWGAGLALMADGTRREADLLHDRQLEDVALLVLHLSDHEIDELGPVPIAARIVHGLYDTDQALGSRYRFQVWSDDGRLMLTNFGRPSPAPMARFGVSGFSRLEMGGGTWRVLTVQDRESGLEVQVAEDEAQRGAVPTMLDGRFIVIALLSLCGVLLPSLWLLHRMLAPLRELAGVLQQRSPTHLQPVQIGRAPRELAPVLAAVNGLLTRVAEAIRREGAFTALVAHELRTPHATLRLQADAVQVARTDDERARALQALVATSDRCSHLQDQLLTLSRLEAVDTRDRAEEVELVDIVTDVFDGWLALARSREVKLVSQLDGSALRAHRFGVQTLLGNLVGNAVRHAPPGGRVVVTTSATGVDAVLRVDDSGPGVPAADRERIFERFERLRPDRGGGVGLGLSIVRAVAQAHGASVTLSDSPLGGLRVEVVFHGCLVQRPAWPVDDLELGPAPA